MPLDEDVANMLTEVQCSVSYVNLCFSERKQNSSYEHALQILFGERKSIVFLL